jgi:soluble lytic murein transglycosylase-like protein
MDLLSVTGLSELKPRVSTADNGSVTWWVALFLVQDASSIRASMQVSLEQQHVSVRRQAAAAKSRRRTVLAATVPRIDASCEAIPEPELGQMIDDASLKHGLNAVVVREVARQESAFRPCAISVAGAEGLMQLMPSTQADLQVRNPFDPRESLDAGAKLLKELIERYHGDLKLALGAYNAGPARVDEFRGIPEIPETQNYVSDILLRLPQQSSPPLVPFP